MLKCLYLIYEKYPSIFVRIITYITSGMQRFNKIDFTRVCCPWSWGGGGRERETVRERVIQVGYSLSFPSMNEAINPSNKHRSNKNLCQNRYFSHTMMTLTSEDSEEIRVLRTRSLSNLSLVRYFIDRFTLNDRLCSIRRVLFDSVSRQ